MVVPYDEAYQEDFERLNLEWIREFFRVEDKDREQLEHPLGTIVEPGGQVFFVLERGQVVGTSAVICLSAGTVEIAKMAVDPMARGRGYGDLLMQTCIGFARDTGATEMIIESNTVLEPAIALYHKHGFVTTRLGPSGSYERGNIELRLQL